MYDCSVTVRGLEQLPATFSYRQALDRGVTKWQLYRWRDQGVLEPLGRGLYRRMDAPLADLDLIEVAHRAPQATLCLTTALVRHDLSDAIPASHDVALPKGRRRPIVTAPVTWHTFDAGTFDIGRETEALDEDMTIGLYNATRTIVDVVRLAPRRGSDVAVEALRRWLRAGGTPSDLLEMANNFPRTLSRLETMLEIML
jgi:hypothetical protein